MEILLKKFFSRTSLKATVSAVRLLSGTSYSLALATTASTETLKKKHLKFSERVFRIGENQFGTRSASIIQFEKSAAAINHIGNILLLLEFYFLKWARSLIKMPRRALDADKNRKLFASRVLTEFCKDLSSERLNLRALDEKFVRR